MLCKKKQEADMLAVLVLLTRDSRFLNSLRINQAQALIPQISTRLAKIPVLQVLSRKELITLIPLLAEMSLILKLV